MGWEFHCYPSHIPVFLVDYAKFKWLIHRVTVPLGHLDPWRGLYTTQRSKLDVVPSLDEEAECIFSMGRMEGRIPSLLNRRANHRRLAKC